MSHKPHFTFRTHGGVCAGEQWIYDGEDPIARLDNRRIEQPEQNLRYFDKVLKPVNLYDLKLTPGGRPLVCGVQLYWKLSADIATTELVAVDIAGQESARLVLTVTTRDPGEAATSRRVVIVTYSDEIGSYVYDFHAHLEFHSPEMFDAAENVQFEYSDPWYSDIPGPTVDFPGHWQRRYSHFLAEEENGNVWQMPINHMATGIPSPRSFARDGLFVLGFDSGNNPAFQFVGDTAARTSIGVCNWGYDIHLSARYSRDELYKPVCPHFRIRLCPDADALDLMDRAIPPPPVEYAGFTELPAYERSTSFAKGIHLNQPTVGPFDPWPWLPEGDGCQWCRNFGRSDTSSLSISKATNGPAAWTMDRESDGAWTERWSASISYRVSCYLRTEHVGGRGSCLALRWGVYNYPQRFPYVCSQKLIGTHDWTYVEVALHGPPPFETSSLTLVLRQDGPGKTWFDDLDVEIL